MDKDAPIKEAGDTKNDFWMKVITNELSNIAGAIENNTEVLESLRKSLDESLERHASYLARNLE